MCSWCSWDGFLQHNTASRCELQYCWQPETLVTLQLQDIEADTSFRPDDHNKQFVWSAAFPPDPLCSWVVDIVTSRLPSVCCLVLHIWDHRVICSLPLYLLSQHLQTCFFILSHSHLSVYVVNVCLRTDEDSLYTVKQRMVCEQAEEMNSGQLKINPLQQISNWRQD